MQASAHTIAADISSAVDSAVKSGRRRLAGIDLDAIQQTATAVARATLPAAFAPPAPRRRRWPIAGALIVLAVAILGFLYMGPMVRSRAEEEAEQLPDVELEPA